MLRRLITAIGIVVALSAIVAVEVSVLTPYYGEICSNADQADHENCARYNLVLVILWHLTKRLNDYGVALTAVATIVVAAFTATLWKATNRQAEINDRLATIAHRQFVADHRPRIKVRWIEPSNDDVGDPKGRRIGAFVNFRNTGANEARIIQIHARIFRGFTASPRNLMTFPGAIRQVDRLLRTGQGDREFIDSEFRDHAELNRRDIAARQQLPPETIFLIGRIQYLDQRGATWETGFCYQLLFPNLVWDRVAGELELNYEE